MGKYGFGPRKGPAVERQEFHTGSVVLFELDGETVRGHVGNVWAGYFRCRWIYELYVDEAGPFFRMVDELEMDDVPPGVD